MDAYCYTSLDFSLRCVSGGEIRRRGIRCGKSEFERTAISCCAFRGSFSCFEEIFKEKYRYMKGWKEDEEKIDLWSGIYLFERIVDGMPYEA